ncbi:MAG: hypothetical protein HYY16_02795 [Planctomycetes bacterium]|nr:hypothetical protein [Planctomycetota bacterium]
MKREAWGIAMLAMVGCTIPRYAKGEWPEDLPSEAYYARTYLADARNRELQTPQEYFDWVLRFYKGYMVATGWHVHELALVKLISAEEYIILAPQLAHLGTIISAEWAKHNSLRRITNETLALWGRVLKAGAKQNRAGEALERLTADVHAILDDELRKADVTAERYEDILSSK